MRRLRQVAIVAHDRDRVVADLREVLGIAVAHEDPAIGSLGLHNAVLPIGDQFLEVVAPVRDGTTAGRYLDRRGGDSGYLLIVQTDEHAAHVRAVEELGVRIVARYDAEGFTDVQLHPADTGGAFLEIDEQDPPADWHPAGLRWRSAVRMNVSRGVTAAEVACADPDAVADRWSRLLLVEVTSTPAGPDLQLDDAVLRFRPVTDDRGEGIVGIEVDTLEPGDVIARARRRGLSADEHGRLTIGGLQVRPVVLPSSAPSRSN
jgi:hypothetical protein